MKRFSRNGRNARLAGAYIIRLGESKLANNIQLTRVRLCPVKLSLTNFREIKVRFLVKRVPCSILDVGQESCKKADQ
jgi:hypothetical protein